MCLEFQENLPIDESNTVHTRKCHGYKKANANANTIGERI